MSSRCASNVRSIVPALLLALAACHSEPARTPPPPPVGAHGVGRAEITNEYTATAQVTAIAPEKRVVTLKREDGLALDVQCGEGVRNFDQIAVGDTVRVHYKEALAATKLAPGESVRAPQGAITAARAKEGAKPGAGLGVGISLDVKIESIDQEHGIVVFSLPSGELLAHRIATSQGREFVRGLAVGDKVQLDYAEVLALGVEKL